MSIPPEHLYFEFELDEHVQREEGSEPPLLLEVVGRVRLFSGAGIVFRDEAFPIAEFALQLADWCEDAALRGEPFSFETAASAIPGLVRIIKGYEGWRLCSIQEELSPGITHPLGDFVFAARDYIERVEVAVQERLQMSIYGFRSEAFR